jgi:hypothetical protein
VEGRRPRAGLSEGSRGWRRGSQGSAPAAGRQEAIAGFRAAVRAITLPEPPKPKSKRKAGQGKAGGDRFSAAALVENYLELCRDPAKDLLAWVAEDRKRPGGIGRRQPTATRIGSDHHAEQTLAEADGLRRISLPRLQVRLDAHGAGRGHDALPSRPRAAAAGHDGVQSPRVERSAGNGIAWRSAGREIAFADGFGAEAGAIAALFRTKLAGLRRRLRPSEIPVAVRVLQEEKQAALKALRERRQTARAGERLKRRQARAPPHVRPS